MRALVTGGVGFIGSQLSELLLALGHEVVIVDDLSSGRLENIESFNANPALSIRRVDIRNLDELSPCFAGVDWVFHLAGLADIVPSIEAPPSRCRASPATIRFARLATSISGSIPATTGWWRPGTNSCYTTSRIAFRGKTS